MAQVYIQSYETRIKRSKALKGMVKTPEHCRRISEALKGRFSPNKGRTNWFKHSEETKHKMSEDRRGAGNHRFGKEPSPETKEKMSIAKVGKKLTDEHKKKIGLAGIGRKASEETRKKMSIAQSGEKHPFYGKHHTEESKIKTSNKIKGRVLTLDHKRKLSESHRGERCHFWKDGITPLHLLIRTGAEYSEWRIQVFERDDYTCQKCGKRGGVLNVHHVKSFSSIYRESSGEDVELFDINNGLTLCKKCHRNYHKSLKKRQEVRNGN